jgi:hypothetical protein
MNASRSCARPKTLLGGLGQNLKGRLALRYRFASRVEESPESKDVFRRLLQASSSRYEEQ